MSPVWIAVATAIGQFVLAVLAPAVVRALGQQDTTWGRIITHLGSDVGAATATAKSARAAKRKAKAAPAAPPAGAS